jgi:ABC-type Fe3+/spermidine/putrescine transport system ATPase subunit
VTRVELVGVSKTYPRQPAPAAASVSLAAEPGSLLALLGPSGSGKSTLLKLIAGVEAPDSGEIRLDGRSVLAVPAHRRGAVLMFQKAYLFPFLSVAENIAFGLRVQGVARAAMAAEVARMLALVGLPGVEAKRPAQLSGGEQQRVALARALVTRPRVLLLDEPFSSLDPAVRLTLQEAVRGLQRDLGITTLLVSHDRAEALAMADRVALLDRGELLACDTPERIFRRPPTRRAARLMGVSAFLRGELAGPLLHTPLGALAVDPAGRPDGPATFAIRPEQLRLRDAPAPNALPARVLGRSFRGEQSEYRLQVRDDMWRIWAAQPDLAPDGGQVYVELPAEHLFPVDDDEPEPSPKGDCEHP